MQLSLSQKGLQCCSVAATGRGLAVPGVRIVPIRELVGVCR